MTIRLPEPGEIYLFETQTDAGPRRRALFIVDVELLPDDPEMPTPRSRRCFVSYDSIHLGFTRKRTSYTAFRKRLSDASWVSIHPMQTVMPPPVIER